MFRRCLPAAALALAWAATPAAAQVSLEWKFKAGDVFYLEEDTKSKFTAEVGGMKMPQEQTSVRVSRFTVKKRTREGVVLEQEILSWTASNNGMAEDKLNEIFKGAKFTVTLAPDGSIRGFDGYKDVKKKLEDSDPVEGPLLAKILTEQVFKAPLEMVFSVLPDKAVKKGDKWEREIKASLGPIGSVKIKKEYSYVGPGRDGDVISSTGKMSFAVGQDDGGLPFKITKLDLKAQALKGTVVFDRNAGRVVRYELQTPMTAEMTIEAGGNAIDLTMEGVENRAIRLHANNPLNKS